MSPVSLTSVQNLDLYHESSNGSKVKGKGKGKVKVVPMLFLN